MSSSPNHHIVGRLHHGCASAPFARDADAMITAHDLILDQFALKEGSDKRLTTWYAQGQSDALGDRLLMFDNTNLPSWEILRFRPALAHNPTFEAAVRQRVEQLSSVSPRVVPTRPSDQATGTRRRSGGGVDLSSGASLSEALKKPRSVEFALRLIRQLVPALAAFSGMPRNCPRGADRRSHHPQCRRAVGDP